MKDEVFYREIKKLNVADTTKMNKILKDCEKQKKSIIKEINKKYKETELELKKKEKRQIDDDRTHREIINSCVTPFILGEKAAKENYVFVRGSPLEELGVPNFDFLIFNRQKNILIFGEATNTSSYFGAEVTKLEKRRKEAIKNIDYILKKYLKSKSKIEDIYIEFVVAVPFTEAQEIFKIIKKRRLPFIIWQVTTAGDAILSVYDPFYNFPEERANIHKDKKLNKILNKCKTNRKIFNIFPQTHPCAQLKILVLAITDKKILDKDSLKEILSKEMPYFEDDEIEKIMCNIITNGEKVGILYRDGNDYILKTKSKVKERIEKEIEEKWIKWKIEEKKKIDIEKEISKINDECFEKIKKLKVQKTLDEF